MRLLRMLRCSLSVTFQYLENYPLGLDMLDITNFTVHICMQNEYSLIHS
jgi:hypothetical protein